MTQVVGGDFFGILAALKYRVIVNSQQKKLRQGLKGRKDLRRNRRSMIRVRLLMTTTTCWTRTKTKS